jgi:hypothetical protein
VKSTKAEDVFVTTGLDANLIIPVDQMFVTTDKELCKVFNHSSLIDLKENVFRVIQGKHLLKIEEAAHAQDQMFWIG